MVIFTIHTDLLFKPKHRLGAEKTLKVKKASFIRSEEGLGKRREEGRWTESPDTGLVVPLEKSADRHQTVPLLLKRGTTQRLQLLTGHRHRFTGHGGRMG